MSRANLDKDPDEVAAMFDGVADRYDLVNDLLSLGRTKAWRKSATAIIDPKPGMKILDLAAGTGSLSPPAEAGGWHGGGWHGGGWYGGMDCGKPSIPE